jgi:glycosyltransferase involved in cell wall biosynthesis
MKRVVFVVPWGEALGGAEIMLLSLLQHLDRTRVLPSVVFLQPGPFERDVAALDVQTRSLSSGRLRQGRRFHRTTGELAHALDERDADITCAWSAKAHLYTAIATRRRGSRGRSLSLWWQHAIPDGGWLDRVATALPTTAIGCSSGAGAIAQRRLFPRRTTLVVHPGAEEIAGASRTALRAELAIPADRFVVGIVGRLQPWKNQHRLLDAVALLRSEGLPVHALVVGGSAYGLSPEYACEIDARAARSDLAGAVTMTGQVPDARRLIPAADVLVNASEAEPFGIVLIEAMAAGVPVVAIARGGPAEIVEHERSGLLVASSDPRDLAAALRRLACDPGMRARLGAGGRRRFVEHFTATHMADTFAGAVERLHA